MSGTMAVVDPPGRAQAGAPDWQTDGRDWPNRENSRFVRSAGLRWHVQVMGEGPPILLLHGTGAATHSWRDLAPALARTFRVIAPDLPGHGFTATPPGARLSLPGMTRSVRELLASLGTAPVLAVGHSAGAAILARMALDRQIAPRGLVSLNGALLPLGGTAGRIFSPIARLLAAAPIVPRLFALTADRAAVARLMRDTGSRVDAAGLQFYGRLARRPAHVAGALGMMAKWDLAPLARDLPLLSVPFLAVIADGDRTIRPDSQARAAALVPGAASETMEGVGHLAHEERPQAVAEIIVGFARTVGAL